MTKEQREEYLEKEIVPVYEEMRNLTPEEIGKILREDWEQKLLAIAGAFHDKDRVVRCEVAMMIAINFLLKSKNDVSISEIIEDET